jgi:UDP-3-O-[3-hydroxymyristoyl] glucosamine N-acyltransferase
VIRERCRLGARCLLHANAVVGTDGFGYRPQRTAAGVTLVKMPHLGHVELGDDCELGACCTIDRGKLAPTTLGHGCKLDNHVQIGHNCRLGNLVVIAGCSALAGSVTVGDGTMIGGQVAIKEHLTIGRGVQLAGGAQLMHHIPDGEVWAGSPAQPIRQTLREIAAIQRLPDFMRAARKLVQD